MSTPLYMEDPMAVIVVDGEKWGYIHTMFYQGTIWSKDLSKELPVNPGPYGDEHLKKDNGWWQRKIKDIDIITLHHTLSDDPFATAKHYITKDGGRPTLPYTIWVTQTGEILKLVDLEQGLWHDHTGHRNTHLSVGLAGSLHIYHPPKAQLEAAARVAIWAIESDKLPLIKSAHIETGQIKGHMDFIGTQCPGWNSATSGRWKQEFYDLLKDYE